jgi:hypothetical protein
MLCNLKNFLPRLEPALAQLGLNKLELSASEHRAVNEYDKRHSIQQTNSLIRALCVLSLLALMPPVVFLAPPHQQRSLMFTHLSVSILSLGWLALKRVTWLSPRYFLCVLYLVASFGYGESLHQGFLDGLDSMAVTYGCVLYAILMITNLASYPFSNSSVLIIAVLQLVLGAYGWRTASPQKQLEWTILLSFISSFGLFIHYASRHRRRLHMLNELATRALLSSNERLRLEDVEREIKTASEMQDAFAPSQSSVDLKGLTIQTFQSKYGLLAGDWTAVQKLQDGSVVVIVADATGKGLQAALVVQTLQTLWTNIAIAADFSPIDWLHDVNRTLHALSHLHFHTMSLGMLVLRDHDFTYYSAGHLPLFLIQTFTGTSSNVTPVLARGSLLGFAPELKIAPVTINTTNLNIDSILLGSDGVFDKGVRTNKRSVLSLLHHVESQGVQALNECMTADDKSLVWIKRTTPHNVVKDNVVKDMAALKSSA